MSPMNEDTLVQQTTAEYLESKLGWESIYAYDNEIFGENGLLGRRDEKQIVLRKYLKPALQKLNPNLPDEAYEEAMDKIEEKSFLENITQINKEKYELIREGVQVQFKNKDGKLDKKRLRVIEFDPEKVYDNHFLCVRELWIKGDLYRRRADIICFVNGLPLVFMELKTIYKNIRHAYDKNFSDYKDTVPHIFHHNAIVVLANGDDAKLGSISSKFEHFHEWKRLEEGDAGVVDMETLLKGVFNKKNLIDIFENFILFDESSGKLAKIVARNHQFIGVNRALSSLKDMKKNAGKLGVFWHTQGSGKSYSMVYFTKKIHRKVGSNYTFLICTDREDLDSQIYKTFAGCGVVNNDKDPCRSSSGEHLKELLSDNHKGYVFTMIQKFNKDVDKDDPYSNREDVIVISDEAHRSQYGRLALNMRNALPNAGFIGFTGTPLFKEDEITKRIFGGYVSTYDFQRAVDDKATVPLFYDARGEKLNISTEGLNDKIAQKLEEFDTDDIDIQQRLEADLKRDYHVITAQGRLEKIAKDFVNHYSTAWETGKSMMVCIDKITCVRVHELVEKYWKEKIAALEKEANKAESSEDEIYKQRQIAWMKETKIAVIISEEQGEVAKFKNWNIDITPYRKLLKEGYEVEGEERISLEDAFKEKDHPFRVAIVCAMWLTGFDVPSLTNLYLDKPLKAHTLMQAIARANRIAEGKNNGLIVDYCGILKNLRRALATFAGHEGEGEIDPNGNGPEVDPVKPDEKLLASLEEAKVLLKAYLAEKSVSMDMILNSSGFDRNAAIKSIKNAINNNDQSRKKFEVTARTFFKRFKACIATDGVNSYKNYYDAVNIVYKSLQDDRDSADISHILKELQGIIDGAINPRDNITGSGIRLYDISKIDFDRLRREFERNSTKNTTVQNLKDAIDKRLERMIRQNPSRTNFEEKYRDLINEYNLEKDRVTIEQTFEALIRFVQDLDNEDARNIREGLDEESLALFDLLKKDNLKADEIKKIKKVASELLELLKKEKLKSNWREKPPTRDDVKITIKDYLWSEQTGLPETYTETEIELKADLLFQHIFTFYPTDKHIYEKVA